jgi:hypothetical protein
MTRKFRLILLAGVLAVVGLTWPSEVAAQRHNPGHGGGGGGTHVAVPRTHPPYGGAYYRSYYRPYYYRPYYYPYYAYRPYYYSPWYYGFGFGVGFGFGSYWGGYAPYYSYPYAYPYAYPYGYSYPYPYPYSAYPYAYPSSAQPPENMGQGTGAAPPTSPDFGTLSIRVTPGDATILIDGEVWDRPGGEDRFSIDLPAGSHKVEVRKTGYGTYVRNIDVTGGRIVTLNVGLTTGGLNQTAARSTQPAVPRTQPISRRF